MNRKLRRLFSLSLIVIFVIALFAGCSEGAESKKESEKEERTAKQVFKALNSSLEDANSFDVDMDFDFDVTADSENIKAGVKLGMKANGESENFVLVLDLSKCPDELMDSLASLFVMGGIDISKVEKEIVTLTVVDKVLYADVFGEKIKLAMDDSDFSADEILEQFTPSEIEVPDINFKDLFSKSNSKLEKFILKQTKLETKGTDSVLTMTFDKKSIIEMLEIAKEEKVEVEGIDEAITAFKDIDDFDVVMTFVVDENDKPKEMSATLSMAGAQKGATFNGKLEYKLVLNNFGKAVEIVDPSDVDSYVDLETYIAENEELLNMIAGLNASGEKAS